MSWHIDLGGYVPRALPAKPAGNQREIGAKHRGCQGSQAAGEGLVEAEPCLPGFIKRAVMNPLGRSSPHALHSGSLLVQREAFDSHRQLSDGTKSLTLHSSSCPPPSLPPLALTSWLSPPHRPRPLDFSPPPQPSPSCSVKNTTARADPSCWILSQRKEDCNSLGWASRGERKEEKEICTFDRGEEAGEKGGGRREGERAQLA